MILANSGCRRFQQWAMVTGLLFVPRLTNAADDDVLEAGLPQINVQVHVNELTFDQWTYGTDAGAGQKAIDDEINKLVRTLVKQNQLSEEQQDKLLLAARVDKQRHLREIEDLRVEFDKSRTNLTELRRISVLANQIRGRRANLFGMNSFFMKSRHKILARTDPSAKLNKWHQRHRTNIESAIRGVERLVALRESQKRSLTEYLLARIRVTYTDTGFEDLLVDYQIAKLPRENLQLQFDDDQWPRVLEVLDVYLGYGVVLRDKGLIDRVGNVIYSSNPNRPAPDPGPVVDADPVIDPVPVPDPEPIRFRFNVANGNGNGNVAKVFRKGLNEAVVQEKFGLERRQPVVPISMPARHRANADSAVRELSRKVKLSEETQNALVGLLLDEVSAPTQFGAFDDLVLKHRLSQMSEDKLKPLFAADAWPQLEAALEEMSEVGVVLNQEGLLPKLGVAAQKPVDKRQDPDRQGKNF